MDIKQGQAVSVRHYSLINTFNTSVVEAKGQTIVLHMTKHLTLTKFIEGDPIVVAYESDDEVRIIGGRVLITDINNGIITVSVDIHDMESQMRMYERFPVSLYADIRFRYTRRKCFATIKDVSEYGMLIFSSEDMVVGQQLIIDIYLDREILSQEGSIVRKHQGPYSFEYGLRLIHNGPLTYNNIKQYIKKSQLEHINKFKVE